MSGFPLDKWYVSYYDSMYCKDVYFYFDDLEQASVFAKEQLEACRDLVVKMYYVGQ